MIVIKIKKERIILELTMKYVNKYKITQHHKAYTHTHTPVLTSPTLTTPSLPHTPSHPHHHITSTT